MLRSSLRGNVDGQRDLLELGLEVVGLHLANQFAFGIEEKRRGPVAYTEGLLNLAVGIEQDRETESCGRPRYLARRVLPSRRARRTSWCPGSGRSRRRICRAHPRGRRRSPSCRGRRTAHAGPAPVAPELERDPLAFVIRDLHVLAHAASVGGEQRRGLFTLELGDLGSGQVDRRPGRRRVCRLRA